MPREIVQPKIRGFICTNAHPAGCAQNIELQFQYVQNQFRELSSARKINALIIGASTGYGLSSRIVLTGAYHANTIGIFYERAPQGNKTGSAGYYNTVAVHKKAHELNVIAKSINGDAFSNDIKKQAVDIIRNEFGKLDYIIYSLAAPRRIHPQSGQAHQSVLKPIGQPFTGKTIDLNSEKIMEVTLEPAGDKEIQDTIAVMGGEDWQLWSELLLKEKLLNENIRTIAYSYIGPELTQSIYRTATIGKAKEHLEQTGIKLNKILSNELNGQAWISVNKAVVTQASAAIPVVPLYISLLYKVMKDKGIHEGCIEQISRLFLNYIGPAKKPIGDDNKRIRLDDWELKPEVQRIVQELWDKINSDNLKDISDYNGYKLEFYNLFGFAVPGIDYQEAVEIGELI